MGPVDLVEIWRGGMPESVHRGHAVVWDRGGLVESWGDPAAVIFPRSSCKMIQALPLIESGAADAAGLGPEQLALACASHQGAAIHTSRVGAWLGGLGLAERDLRCGAHMPNDPAENRRLTCADEAPCQLHNNCSGKHAGFLTWTRHAKAGPEYHEPDHPLQQAVRAAFEEVTGEPSPGYGIDGCSAPNFATSVAGLARAMAAFADPGADARGQAMARLTAAMTAHPELVAGEGRACTLLMRAMGGRVAVKTGAEAVFVAIAPERGMGIALKIADGATRASEAAITALLVRHGLLDAGHPVVGKLLSDPLTNWRGLEVAERRLAEGFAGPLN
ncbi:asparaginase [Paracoccus sanguinis]|uniref:Asparaginase n=1 Tax=Paracoccus sanguinis TaxID=1545044 RepID=A0A1H2T0G0_9RHOB|nr:asparaginase [Paracoccus sanguinis]KGJ17973.1 L-asparaginase [Paracoccus sanguinis]SDW37290.1 asparaginase [Paracoccus sanguinis]